MKMEQGSLAAIIREQTRRALWEIQNVIGSIPNELWEREYCGMPCWKHVYHMLHSLDLWYINPRDRAFKEPDLHEEGLNNLDLVSSKRLSREEIGGYFAQIEQKISGYLADLTDQELLQFPSDCEYCRFTLILAQFRHLHSHMGMIMGYIIADAGLWPRVLGLESPFPAGEYEKYF